MHELIRRALRMVRRDVPRAVDSAGDRRDLPGVPPGVRHPRRAAWPTEVDRSLRESWAREKALYETVMALLRHERGCPCVWCKSVRDYEQVHSEIQP